MTWFSSTSFTFWTLVLFPNIETLMSMETCVTCSGEERGGVVEGHEVARGGHGVAGPGEGGASGRRAGEPAALYRVSRALPATSMSSISSGHSIDIKMCDL